VRIIGPAKAVRDFEALSMVWGFPHPAVPFAGLGHRDHDALAAGIGLPPDIRHETRRGLAGEQSAIRSDGPWEPASEASGWAFEFSSVHYPDTDDTAMVLMAMRLAQPAEEESLRQIFRRGLP
jgi:hypothetical protein